MSPVDARNDTEKISMACLCKDDTAQINSLMPPKQWLEETTGEKVAAFCALPESLRVLCFNTVSTSKDICFVVSWF